VAAGLALVAGCSDDSGIAQRYRVSGTVKYKGQPVPKGTITFTPTESGGRPASGDIKDGQYSLTTSTPNDGALPGQYKVTVTAVDVDQTALKEIAKGGQFHHDEAFLKANQSAKQLVPSKYSLVETSTLKAEVKPSTNNLPFDLED
jgi:hypothetical protein